MAVSLPQGEYHSSSSTASNTQNFVGSSKGSRSTKVEQSSLHSEDDELAEIDLLTIKILVLFY